MLYKRPESVLVVIYTKKQEVLLLQRCDVPDFWQSVTGSLEATETALQAAKREVYEETGLVVGDQIHDCQHTERFIIQAPWRARYAPSVTHNTEYTFILPLPTRQPIHLNPQEHISYQWLPYQVALESVSSCTNKQAILKWVAPLNRVYS